MLRSSVDLLHSTLFYDLSVPHHHDTIADLVDDIEIMADEQVAQFISVLQFIQQLQDLSLDRYVQSRDRLVRNDELRPCDHGRGDADSLALSSGQLPGPSLKVLVIQTDGVKGLPDRFAS